MRRAIAVMASTAASAALVACAGAGDPSTMTTAPSTTASPPATPTTATTTTPTPTTSVPSIPDTTSVPEPDGAPVLPLALDHMPDPWREALFIPYGEGTDTLGTSVGGDGEGIWWGPEYGAQGSDGTWWFLDAAKYRVARFSDTGDFIEEWVVPDEMLVDGVYFQYVKPIILADGTFLASRLDGERTHFLRIREGALDEFSVPIEMTPRVDDGTTVYGHSFDSASGGVAVDPVAGTAVPVEWFRTRDGRRFAVTGGASGLGVELPDVPATVDLTFEAAQVGGPVYVIVEAASGDDGTLHLFLLGFPDREPSLQLAGYLTVTADGVATPLEPIIDPFTPADTGSPSRLGVRPGSDDVWFMNVGTDGIRVFVRS